jgi:hypothetical protein
MTDILNLAAVAFILAQAVYRLLLREPDREDRIWRACVYSE